MKKEIQVMTEKKLIGVCVKTNNANETNPETSKIAMLLGQYFGQNVAGNIPGRVNPGVTLCCYTEYETNETGDYLYFIGEEVASIDAIPDGLRKLVIPASQYVKFTTDEGQMPAVVIAAWQAIWQMNSEDFGGKRTFKADFEVYDHRAIDPAKTVVDIFIGIYP